MNTVIRHIEYLISRTDCVIIPGLGALLARYEDASICPASQRYMPPKRVFSFNSAITISDGAIACSIARAQGLSFQEAQAIVKAEVEAMARQLKLQGKLPLGRAGILEIDPESSAPIFSDFGDDQLSVATAWLPIVEKAVAAEVATPVREIAHQTPEYQEDELPLETAAAPRMPRVRPFVRAAKIAASIAILLGIGLVASTPIAVDDATLASLYPEIKTADAGQLMPASLCNDGWATADEEALPTPAELAITNNCDYPMGPEIEPLRQEPFMVVLASFSSQAEADKHIASHPAQSLKVCVKDGRYRVYEQAFASEQQAYAAIANMPAGVGAWVCKR